MEESMIPRNKCLLLFGLVIAIIVLLSTKQSGAVSNGNGVCDGIEDTLFECAQFGTNVIELLGTTEETCNLPVGSKTFVRCTAYRYLFTGTNVSQINVAIPKEVMTKFRSADRAVAGCSQLITDNSGDPTTGFGKNFVTHNICRVAISSTNLPTPFTIRADPSDPLPESWQIRQNPAETFADSLLAPGSPRPPIAETSATLRTSEGVTVSYTNVGGQITITGGTAVPISDTKLCIFNGGPDRTFNTTNWTCETIASATDQCDIKTTGADPCRFIGGTCISY
jgi:hypothetical protein